MSGAVSDPPVARASDPGLGLGNRLGRDCRERAAEALAAAWHAVVTTRPRPRVSLNQAEIDSLLGFEADGGTEDVEASNGMQKHHQLRD